MPCLRSARYVLIPGSVEAQLLLAGGQRTIRQFTAHRCSAYVDLTFWLAELQGV